MTARKLYLGRSYNFITSISLLLLGEDISQLTIDPQICVMKERVQHICSINKMQIKKSNNEVRNYTAVSHKHKKKMVTTTTTCLNPKQVGVSYMNLYLSISQSNIIRI